MLPLPKVRLPTKVASTPQEQAPSRTSGTSVRGDVLSGLLQGGPRTKPASSAQGRSPLLMSPPPKATAAKPVIGSDSASPSRSVFASELALVSAEPALRRTARCVEVVARFPGAVEVCVESMRQGEAPVLVVSKVHDAAVVGGFGDAGDCLVTGLALMGVSRTPNAVVSPERPVSLHAALAVLGPRAQPDLYPLYLHLCDKDHLLSSTTTAATATTTTTTATTTSSSSSSPPLVEVSLSKVVVATNRRPIVEGGSAKFASSLDLETQVTTMQDDADENGLYWGFAVLSTPPMVESNPFSAAKERGGSEDLGIQDVAFVGWVPAPKEKCLEALRGAASAEGDGECLAYVHGFNTNLQFAARTALFYAVKFQRKAAFCFAWPSNPPLPKTWAISAVLSVAERNYTAAEQMMQRSVAALVAVASDLATTGRRIQWKAHSMGCYLVLNAVDRVLQRLDVSPATTSSPTTTTSRGGGSSEEPTTTQKKKKVPIVFESTRRPKKKTVPPSHTIGVLTSMFCRVVLDAPDAPTWFFVDAITRAARHDVRFLHLFHSQDEAVEIARQRRGLEFPAPGNGRVAPDVPGLQVVDCSNAKASMGNHDYGRKDDKCLDDQRGFLDGKNPEDRNLAHSDKSPGLWILPSASSSLNLTPLVGSQQPPGPTSEQ